MAHPQTIVGLFLKRVDELGDREALLERRGDGWVSFGWNEWHERSRAIGAALMADGVEVADHVAILSYSRRQWVEADIGILMTGARTVTIYHNLTPASVGYILRDSGVKVVFAEGPIQLKSLVESDALSDVHKVVYTEERQTSMAREGEASPQELSVEDAIPADHPIRERLEFFEEFVARGERLLCEGDAASELQKRVDAIDIDTVAKVVYTSGTTGNPKGAMLTHGNLIFVVESVQAGLNLQPTDLMLLFLPLAHVYAQLAYHTALKVGFKTAFARSMLTAIDDAESVRPHFFTTVPRLFEKIHAAAVARVEEAGGLKKKVFDWASHVGYEVSSRQQRGEQISLALRAQLKLSDKLVFSKLNERLGGRVRYMISGGAPLPRHILEFFFAANLPIIEGYGMTENASLSHYNRVDGVRFGTVGQPIPGLEVRLDDDGEILMRGGNVMVGYLGKPEETADAIDEEGWLHSGDVGEVDEFGYLTITDRKKEIIVTSGGKNIPPAPIEKALSASTFVSQAIVFGDQKKYLVALLTLDTEYARLWAKERGIVFASGEEMANSAELLRAVEADVAKVNATLDSFSTIKRVALLPRDFSVENEEMTPSLKLKRRIIGDHFAEEIEALYPPESGRC